MFDIDCPSHLWASSSPSSRHLEMVTVKSISLRRISSLFLVIFVGCLFFLYSRNLRCLSSSSEPRIHPYWSQSFKTLLKPQLTKPENIKLVVLITSRPGDSERRRVIRATWGGRFSEFSNISVIFILGLLPTQANLPRYIRAAEEAKTYKDILGYEFEDTYRNVSLKSYLAFVFALSNFQNAQHIVKADDDSFLFTDNILALIGSSTNPDRKVFYCYNLGGSPPVRQESNKWFISRSLYPNDSYPDYCAGFAYVGTRSAVQVSLVTTKRMEHYFPIDDILFTGLAVQGRGVQIEHSTGWIGSPDKYGEPYSMHDVSESQVLWEWNADRRFRKNVLLLVN